MEKYSNLMQVYGPAAAAVELVGDIYNSSLMTQSAHPLVAGTWTCEVVVPGYSTFCDNVWPLWNLEWVNTSILVSCAFTWIFTWMFSLGLVVAVRKDAFENP